MEILSPEKKLEALNSIAERDDEIISFRGLARAKFVEDKRQQSFRYIFVFEKPHKLRIEALPINMSYAVSLLVSDENDETVFLDIGEKRALVSHDSEEAIRSVLRIPLTKGDLISYLTGRIPKRLVSGKFMEIETQFGLDTATGSLSIVSGEAKDIWTINQNSILEHVKLHDPFNGKLSLEIIYGDYESLGTLRFPKEITLKLPRENLSVSLQMSSSSFNGTYGPNLFITKIPDGFEVRRR